MKEIHERKIMYHMIMALEHDLIEFLYPVLSTNDFSNEMMSKIEARNAHAYNIKEMLEQLGMGDFIELINKCRSKLEITQNEIDFINKNCNSSILKKLNASRKTAELSVVFLCCFRRILLDFNCCLRYCLFTNNKEQTI